MTVQMEKTDSALILAVQGRIDTITAPDLQNELLRAFQKSSSVIMDFADVDYISSAGLRVLLIGQKTAVGKQGSFQLRNVAATVMSVFEVTGFKSILKII